MGTKSSKTEKEDITPNKNDEPKINQNNIYTSGGGHLKKFKKYN